MDSREIENWRKIKQVLEDSGKTETMFYKRAISILSTGDDPLAKFFGGEDGK